MITASPATISAIKTAPTGIVGVVQTPFSDSGSIDTLSLDRLIQDALDSGVDGFLVPAVASENGYLSLEEKIELASSVQRLAEGRVPVIWGTGTFEPDLCCRIARLAQSAGAAAYLVAVSPDLYRDQSRIIPFFRHLSSRVDLPLMIQDWDPGGKGMRVEVIIELFEKVNWFRFLKVETVPAGPKYTKVLEATGGRLHVSGGWAVQQMIEALDRGVHAMIPECSMIRIYKTIDRLHRSGNREGAKQVFERLLPVISFTNQELDVSIRFFKRLLRRKGIFATSRDRLKSPPFDFHSTEIADELIAYVLDLEKDVARTGE